MESTAVDAKPNTGSYMERYEFVLCILISYYLDCEYRVGDVWKSVMEE